MSVPLGGKDQGLREGDGQEWDLRGVERRGKTSNAAQGGLPVAVVSLPVCTGDRPARQMGTCRGRGGGRAGHTLLSKLPSFPCLCHGSSLELLHLK